MRSSSYLIPILLACAIPAAAAAPIANWKEFNPNAVVVPITGADTNAPTFGDGVTQNSAQAAWVGGMFGTVGSPASVTLAVGETLTVSGKVVLTGGSNNNNQVRFGIFHDAGMFALDEGNLWTGGWLHSIGSVATSDLWQGRTDGPFISTAGNAIDMDAVKTRTGLFDGDSVAEFNFMMSITRASATTVDVLSLITGGDGDLSEEYLREDIETSQFTFNALGWLFGGSSALEQVVFSDVDYSVSGGGEARITTIRVAGGEVEIDYEGVEGRSYFLESSTDMTSWPDELEDNISGAGTFTDNLPARFGEILPTRIYYRLRERDPI